MNLPAVCSIPDVYYWFQLLNNKDKFDYKQCVRDTKVIDLYTNRLLSWRRASNNHCSKGSDSPYSHNKPLLKLFGCEN